MPGPRTSRSASLDIDSRSRPSKSACPETRAPCVSRRIVWVATLLPAPDSPTIASVCPRPTWKETPRTASTTPSRVGNETVRSRTSSSGIRGNYSLRRAAVRITSRMVLTHAGSGARCPGDLGFASVGGVWIEATAAATPA